MKYILVIIFFLNNLNILAQLPHSKLGTSDISLKMNVGVMNLNEFADGFTCGMEVGHKFNDGFELSANLQISTNYDKDVKTVTSSTDVTKIKLNKTYVYSDLQFISNFNLSYLFSKKNHNYDKMTKNDFVFGIGLGAFLASRVSVGKNMTTEAGGTTKYNSGRIYIGPSIAYRLAYIVNFKNNYFLGGIIGQNILHEGGAFYCGLQMGKRL